MNIWKDSQQIFQIQVARFANGFLYFLHKLPLIGKHVPAYWYQNYSFKHTIGIISYIIYLLTRLLRKALYVFIMIYLPVTFIGSDKTPFAVQFLYIFIILNVYMGPLFNQKFLYTNKDCYIMLRLMKMETQRYLFGRHLNQVIIDSVCMFLSLFTLFVFHMQKQLPTAFLYTIGCVVFAMLAQIIGVAIHVYYFDKKIEFLYRKNIYSMIFSIIFAIIAYLPLYFQISFLHIITYSIAGVSFILLFALARKAWKYMKQYSYYSEMMSVSIAESMDIINISSNMKKAMRDDVSLQDKDYSMSDLHLDTKDSLHGYEYLNRLFFKRHIRLIMKPLKRRLYIVLSAFLISSCVLYLVGKDIMKVESDILTILPIFVFLMYFMSIGEKVSKAMFMNCDISLLHYGYYRQPKAILKNFKIRCKTLCFYNLIIAFSVCIAASGIAFIGQFPFTWSTLLLFNFTILCLSIFFSVHYLFVYYIFQPYNEDLDMKNPFMGILNSIIYILCYLCIKLDGTPLFVSITLFLTILYIAIALLVVYKFAPKTFHLK